MMCHYFPFSPGFSISFLYFPFFRFCKRVYHYLKCFSESKWTARGNEGCVRGRSSGPNAATGVNLAQLACSGSFHGGFRLAEPLWDFDIRFGAPRLWGLRSRIAGSDRSRRAVYKSRAHQRKSSKQPRKPRKGFFFPLFSFLPVQAFLYRLQSKLLKKV